tara:strand:- start:415 stop:1701 length:1287 start_codon:yes stop_codon:yes gene_type:complete
MPNIEEVAASVLIDEAKVSQTPGNDTLPSEGQTPGSSIAPKAKAKVPGPPPVATDPEVKNKDAEKVSKQTKKAAEPQSAPKTGDKSQPEQGSSKAVKEEELTDEDVLETSDYDEQEEVIEEDAEEIPSTKAGMAKAIFDILRTMDEEALRNQFGAIVNAAVSEEVEEESDEVAELVASEPIKITAEDIDVSEDLNALFNDEAEFSDEFKGKAAIIFESAVVSKVNSEIDRIHRAYENELSENIHGLTEEFTEKVDGYLNYVVEEWMKENELAVERGIKTEITEDFINGLKNLFAEHYIDVPEEKVDVLEGLADKVDELESSLNEAIEKNIDLQKTIGTYEKGEILSSLSDGLADTEVEKLRGLSDGIQFEDVDQYREALGTVKENYFPKAPATNVEEEVDESLQLNEDAPATNSAMAAYTSVLKRAVN